MPLSNKDIARIKETIEERVRRFHLLQFSRFDGAFEELYGLVSSDFCGYGTGAYEKVYSKEDFKGFLETEWEQLPKGVSCEVHKVFVEIVDSTHAVAMSEFTVANPDSSDGDGLGARMTFTWVLKGEQWLIAQLHASIPWDAQPEGVPFPADEFEARARKLQEEVDARTAELAKANRELEIDAAVERIRRASADMEDPSDLIEVVKQIRVEVGALYGDSAVEVGLMQEADEDTFKFWSIFDIQEVPEDLALFGLLYPKNPDPPHPMLDRVWGFEGAYSVLFFDLDDMGRIHASLERYSPEEASGLKAILESGETEGGWQTVSSIQVGRMYLGWLNEPPEEVASVQPRIAAVLTEAQQRVEELRQALHMAREAEINLAVEKVRARASGMQESSEIVDVADVLRQQLIELGLDDVFACTVYTRTPEGKHRVTEMARLEEGSSDYSFDWIFDPADLHPDIMVRTFLAAKDASVFHQDAEAMALLMKEAMKFDPDYTEEYQEAIDQSQISEMWVAVCPSESVRLCIDFKTEPPEEILTILPRMTRAFDHAYRRHQDLERAEAQTRAAEISLAVEKVRARATAMHRSEELADVALTLRSELQNLGIAGVSSATVYTDQGNGAFRIWDMAEIQGVDDSQVHLDFIFSPSDAPNDFYFNHIREAGGYTSFFYEGKRLRNIAEWLEGYDPASADTMNRLLDDGDLPALWISSHPVESGFLSVDTVEAPSEELATILPRMAAAFDLAYRRFEDLKQAEAQTREALIEAALERVRGRALAMRSSEELIEVADELRRQMGLIGQQELEACAIHIYDIPGDDFESWGAIQDPDGNGVAIANEIRLFPKKGVAVLEEAIEAYESDKDQYVLTNSGDRAKEFFDMLKERAPEPYEALIALVPEGIKPWEMKAYWSAADFSGGTMFLVTYQPAGAEALDLLRRSASVLDLAYRRFQDLKEAEAAEREAQIEAALERVRATAMGMQRSEQLSDVAVVLTKQMHILDVPGVLRASISISEEDPQFVRWYTSSKDGEMGYEPARFDLSQLTQIGTYERDQYQFVFEGRRLVTIEKESIPRMYEMFSEFGWDLPAVDSSLDLEAIYDHQVSFGPGVLHWSAAERLSAEILVVQDRFVSVFKQAYTRFLDLQKAEASAREAQIENALEKIRSRTMGMQTGEELKDVVVLLYKELIALGVTDFVTCGYVEIHEDKQIQDTWVTSPGGDTFGLFYLPLQGDATFDARYAAWKRQEPIFHQTVAGQERSDHLEYAITKFNSKEAEEMVRSQFPDPTVFYCFNFSHGYLHIVGGSLLEKEEELLIARFTKVFEQTYTRFLDLKNAEAATREALIEAALERVRAVATAMRSSEELLKVMQHIHKEFSALGFPCGAFWNSRYLETHYEKAVTGLDGEQVTAIMELPRDFSMIPELASWERGNEKLGVFKFGTEASIEYLNHMINKGKFLEIVPDALTEDLLREMKGWTFVQARTTHGELGYNLWGEADPSKEATDTLLRFAAVFDLAFRRFVDLEEAEEAAREARIEVALERVRSRAMAMHDSVELSETIGVMFDQMKVLGFTPVSTFLTLMDEDLEGMTFRMTGRDGSRNMTDIRWESSSMPQFQAVRQAWEKGDTILGAHYTGKSLEDFLEIIDPINNQLSGGARLQAADFEDGLYSCSGRHAFGTLGILYAEPVPQDQQDLLVRFAKEFELVYRRFLDLKKAEAQARESQIEASLERVRGQAMAMQKPEDISDVSIRMFDELESLGVQSLRSGISIPGDGERYVFHAATKDKSGSTTLVLGDESVDVHPIIRRAYDGWTKLEPFQSTMLSGKDLVDYYHAVFDTMPLPDWKERMQRGEEAMESFATFPFQDGWLYTFARHTYSGEELDLYQRFARVFGLAYQRYHDLTKAEEDYQALLAEKARTEKALTDLQATQKQLVEQEKLASLGSLTAGIAHEIKNPLNFVNNFAEVSTELMEELAEAVASGDSEEAAIILADLRDNAEQIAKHGKRADSIVRSMMQHARGGASDIETIVVNEFLEEYANLAWHGMRARDHGFSADVERDFDPEAGSLNVMPQELGRVVLNLLNNAFDAVKEQDDGLVRVGSSRSSDGLTITVSDNGSGIPEDIRQKIFEPFFTTKATGEGTGLGLSLSYDIVTKGHGGTMTVGESAEGGALFTITIPGGAA